MSALSMDLLSSIIDDIYQCSFDASRWTSTLARITDAIGSACTTIHVFNTGTKLCRSVAHSPWDAEQIRCLNETYNVHDVPGLCQIISGDMDVPHSILNEINGASYIESDFYVNWAQPQGLRDGCSMKFAEHDSQICILGTIAKLEQGRISPDDQRFMALLSPHLRRASQVGGLFGQTVGIGKNYQAALEVLGTPVLLLTAERQVIYQNMASDRFFVRQTALTVQNGTLFAHCPLFDRAINAALENAFVLKNTDVRLDRHQRSSVSFYGKNHQDKTKKAMVATIIPLDGLAVVAIFISTAGTTSAPPESIIAELFDLTPGEARVMLQVGKGKCVKTVAQDLDLSVNTIKSHLASIYMKTGIVRQSELVRLLSDISAPLMLTLDLPNDSSEVAKMCA